MKSNYKMLGEYIRQVDVRNKNLRVNRLLGVSISKTFIESIANTVGTDFHNYKVVKQGQFAYGPVTSRNGDKVSIALLNEEECIISSAYVVFEVVDENQLMPEYLMLWFSRPEFDRYARYMSHGSVREQFTWEELCKSELPVPSYEKQQEIVKNYRIISERIGLKKKINDNLEQVLETVYRQWYMEFKSPYANSETSDSEFGQIPVGWHVAELGNYIESFSKTHSFDKDELIFLNTSDILAGDFLCNTYTPVKDMPGQAKKQIKQDDILFSEIRPANKRYALVTFPADDYVVSTKLMVLRTTQHELSNLRIYHYLTLESTLQELHREADGKSGTFPQITFDNHIRHRKFVVADSQTESAFNKILVRYYESKLSIQNEVNALKRVQSLMLCHLSR